ncbi:Leucine-rich_repeat protein [Hexamita inflata]|uniref:Leucine-rich repeat protein n=1 Tax=Hexamita inflata TaxID=28002 RepID=A0AA86NR18_9EUKA|nr:Leucine-rich repeat protein [Hexamita inflata]
MTLTLSQIQSLSEKLIASNCTVLDLSEKQLNSIANLTPLGNRNLRLNQLYLNNNMLTSIQFFPLFYLQELYLQNNQLSIINFQFPFPKLRVLDISNNNISKIMVKLPETIINLNMSNNKLTDEVISQLNFLKQLQQVNISQNYINYETVIKFITWANIQCDDALDYDNNILENSVVMEKSVNQQEQNDRKVFNFKQYVQNHKTQLNQKFTNDQIQEPTQNIQPPKILNESPIKQTENFLNNRPQNIQNRQNIQPNVFVQPIQQQSISSIPQQQQELPNTQNKFQFQQVIPNYNPQNVQYEDKIQNNQSIQLKEMTDPQLIQRSWEELIKSYEKTSQVGFPNPLQPQSLANVRRKLFQLAYSEQTLKKQNSHQQAKISQLENENNQLKQKLQLYKDQDVEHQNIQKQVNQLVAHCQNYQAIIQNYKTSFQQITQQLRDFKLKSNDEIEEETYQLVKKLKTLESKVQQIQEFQKAQKKSQTLKQQQQSIQELPKPQFQKSSQTQIELQNQSAQTSLTSTDAKIQTDILLPTPAQLPPTPKQELQTDYETIVNQQLQKRVQFSKISEKPSPLKIPLEISQFDPKQFSNVQTELKNLDLTETVDKVVQKIKSSRLDANQNAEQIALKYQKYAPQFFDYDMNMFKDSRKITQDLMQMDLK